MLMCMEVNLVTCKLEATVQGYGKKMRGESNRLDCC